MEAKTFIFIWSLLMFSSGFLIGTLFTMITIDNNKKDNNEKNI